MKPETLEALFLDRALGELSPEAAELLDAWSQQHPAEAAKAATISATLSLAREATASDAPVTTLPLPAPKWIRPAWHLRRPELLRLAACLALGAGLGWSVPPLRHTADTTAATVPPPAIATTDETPAATEIENSSAASRFWSISARIEAARRSARPSSQHFHDDPFTARKSHLRMPQPGLQP